MYNHNKDKTRNNMQDTVFEDCFVHCKYFPSFCASKVQTKKTATLLSSFHVSNVCNSAYILHNLDGQYFTQSSLTPFKTRSMEKNIFFLCERIIFSKITERLSTTLP